MAMGPDDVSKCSDTLSRVLSGRAVVGTRGRGSAASRRLPSAWGRRFNVGHVLGRARGHGHAVWHVRGILWMPRLVTEAVMSHGAGDTAGAMSLAGGPLLRVQTTCLGDQTRRRTSIEDVWPWGATPPLGGILAFLAHLGVVSPAFGAPGDVPEGTFDVFDASQGQ